MEKILTFTIPDGYEIDKENSTDSVINLKIKKVPAEEYLLNILSQCTGKVFKNKIVWSINDQWIFEQNFTNKQLLCYYNIVWEVFKFDYGMEYQAIKALHENVVCEALNCKGFTAVMMFGHFIQRCVRL